MIETLIAIAGSEVVTAVVTTTATGFIASEAIGISKRTKYNSLVQLVGTLFLVIGKALAPSELTKEVKPTTTTPPVPKKKPVTRRTTRTKKPAVSDK